MQKKKAHILKRLVCVFIIYLNKYNLISKITKNTSVMKYLFKHWWNFMDFFEKTKGLLFNPSKTFYAVKEETLKEAFKYFIILDLIFSAILFGLEMEIIEIGLGKTIQIGLGQIESMIFGGMIFVVLLVFVIIYIFVVGAFTHISVYLMGGRKGFSQTLKTVMYCQLPSLLIAWNPYFIYISILWTAVLEVIGIRQFQEISTGRAILATIILPPIIATIFLVILIAVPSILLH
jgi:hypothetical protein